MTDETKQSESETKPMTFEQKMLALYERVGYIQKTGRNEHHKYKFLQESVLKRKVSAACREVGLVLTSVTFEAVGECTGKACVIKARVVIGDSSTREAVVLEGYGGGYDSMDKAPQKGCTSAFKAALGAGLMVETGDDPEADAGTDEAAAAEVLTAINAASDRSALELVKPRVAALKGHDEFDNLAAAWKKRAAVLTPKD